MNLGGADVLDNYDSPDSFAERRARAQELLRLRESAGLREAKLRGQTDLAEQRLREMKTGRALKDGLAAMDEQQLCDLTRRVREAMIELEALRALRLKEVGR